MALRHTRVPEIRKGDTVVVLSGKDAGKQGVVDKVIRRSVVDQRAYDAFISVMHMTRGLGALMDPRVLVSVMRSAPPRDPAALAASAAAPPP